MEWPRAASLAVRDLLDGLQDPGSDPRVGSAREGSSAVGITQYGNPINTSSLSSLGNTFVPILVYSGICLLGFLLLRDRCPRVYAPRAIVTSLLPQERIAQLPKGYFAWIKPFFQIPDSVLLTHSSLDAFLFLRFLKMLCIISLVGCCIAWPILIPLHVLGGGDNVELDRLTIGNVIEPTWYYAHVFVAWVFFGFVLYMVCRECIYYINLRQAYLLSPYYAKRLSSRTVLFACVPQQYLDEYKIRKIFGDAVRNVWIPKDTGELDGLVEEREQTATRLERAEIRLIKMANVARRKAGHTGPADRSATIASQASSTDTHSRSSKAEGAVTAEPLNSPLTIDTEKTATAEEDGSDPYGLGLPNLPDVNGSVAAQWIPHESRPHHRPLANFLRRVDTIKWTRNRLKLLNRQIYKLRKAYYSGEQYDKETSSIRSLNAAFVEFRSQAEAQSAYQTLTHHRPLHMSPRYIGVRPHDINWSALRIRWWERIIRRFAMTALITAAIIFWSLPSAFVGTISNISSLVKILPFLAWLTELPQFLMGLITGLVPAVALSLFMAFVPVMLRFFARIAGTTSRPMVEIYVQSAYFAFQVIQVFLVTTLTSAASAALTNVLANPLSAKDLLSQNLPKASNFYLSYILIQSLAISGGVLLQPFQLIKHKLVARFLDNPRKMYKVWHTLREVHWGSIFPVFTNLGVIAISYSCIAPVILGFAGVGLFVVYLVYRYNILFVYDCEIDTKGLVYPRAMMHLLVGLYLAEICMIGLFILRLALAPMLLMLLFFIFSGLVHLALNEALHPLLYNMPLTLSVETDDQLEAHHDMENGAQPSGPGGFNTPPPGWDDDLPPLEEEDDGTHQGVTATRGGIPIEGASGLLGSVVDWSKDKLLARIAAQTRSWMTSRIGQWITANLTTSQHRNHGAGSTFEQAAPNFFLRWLHPEIYEDFSVLRRMMPTEVDEPGYDEDLARRAYYPPEVASPAPRLWLPRDDACVSKQEVAHTGKVIRIYDEGAYLDEKGRIVADLNAAPIALPRILY